MNTEKAVWKYVIKIDDYVRLDVPVGSQFLSFQSQHDVLCTWWLVDTNQKKTEGRVFRLAGTGHPIFDEDLIFLGTAQMFEGDLIYHLFEMKRA